MFVHPSRLKTQGAVFSTLALLALGACDDPVASTDLRPEGAPEVLTVLVMNDPGFFFETATFCKQNDPKRPNLVAAGLSFENVQICPDDLTLPAGNLVVDPDTMAETFEPATVTDAEPFGWYARIMFDELLNPDVEDLIELTEDDDNDPATPDVGTGIFQGSLLVTQPVTLRCTAPGSTTPVDVAYDGYYSPSGNNITWPLGPSLFVQPVDLSTVATSSTCTIELKDSVVDKTGEPVPAEQRTGYELAISALAFAGSDPEPSDPAAPASITADSSVILQFNAFIDPGSLAPGEITILEHAGADCADAAGAVARTAVIGGDPGSGIIAISTAGAEVSCPAETAGDPDVACSFNIGKAYTITFSDDNAVADLAGGPGALPGSADFTLCFVTEAP